MAKKNIPKFNRDEVWKSRVAHFANELEMLVIWMMVAFNWESEKQIRELIDVTVDQAIKNVLGRITPKGPK